MLRKVLKVTVQWPLHLQDTEHRWDYARAITYRLRTVALAASARVCLRAERVQGLLGSGLEGRDHKLANLVRPRREGGINAIRHRRVRCQRWPSPQPPKAWWPRTRPTANKRKRGTREGGMSRKTMGVNYRCSTLRGTRDEGA